MGTNMTAGIYNPLNLYSPANLPGSRREHCLLTDNSGNLYLYGGFGFAVTTIPSGSLGDMWKFNRESSMWAHISGPNSLNNAAQYPPELNQFYGEAIPGARRDAVCGMSSQHEYILIFGGIGYGASVPAGSTIIYLYLFIELIFPSSNHPLPISICPNLISFLDLFSLYSAIHLSDVWRFDLASQQWALVGGSPVGNLLSSFPTLAIENPSTNNHPGGRKVTGSHAGLDANSSELWLFGGFGYGESNPSGYLNDLWRFKPISNSGIQNIYSFNAFF